ncbi:MAG: lactate utilization protein C [Burkholderiales bacterium]
MSAREKILTRVRAAQGRSGEVAQLERDEVQKIIAEKNIGPRPAMQGDLVERFKKLSAEMICTVDEVNHENDVPASCRNYLHKNNLPMSGVAWPSLKHLDWKSAGIGVEFRRANGNDGIGITSVFAALAETGTLMLLSGADTTASVSLVPETHIAVLHKNRIVPYMEDAWALLRKEKGELPRAVNFVSGPSRTADIEQTIVLGAHGPYRVHIILVSA